MPKVSKSHSLKVSKSHNRKGRSRVPVSKVTCTALLVVDQAPFLKKALSACKRLRNELHRKQALLSDFEEQDRSAYQQWLNHTHGKTLTQIRELREEAEAYQFILHHLSHCAYWDYDAVPQLFEELFELKKKGTLYSYEPPKQPDVFGRDDDSKSDGDEGFDDPNRGEWDDDEEDDDEDMRAFFDRMFGGGGASRDSNAGMPHAETAQKAANDARLKTCYRNLAKRLHPDHSELEELVREKRWHEIQEAYQQSDLDALLRIEAICDMDDTGLRAELGLARLHDLAAYHKLHLIPLRNALRAAKQDIAFGFFKKGPSAQVTREVATDLKYERMDVTDMIEHMKRSATSIRDEVAAQLQVNKAAHEAVLRAQAAKARRAERRGGKSAPKAKAKRPEPKAKAKQPKSIPVPKAPHQKEPAPEDPRQMAFF
jgi:hypothetical protein